MRGLSSMASGLRWAVNSGKWKPTAAEWTLAAQCVQTEEKDRIGKFVFKRDAKASMVGRLLLRKAVHEVTGLQNGEIRLERTDKGKPFLKNDLPLDLKDFNFNVSHQGDYVVLAAEKYCQVGVDTMNLDTPRSTSVEKFFSTMKRQFTEEEWRHIRRGVGEKQQLQTFYRLWCLKESYVKALGVGIGFEVKRLNFDLTTPTLPRGEVVTDTKLQVDRLPMSSWRFEECLLEDHIVAVALNTDSSQEPESGPQAPGPLFQTLSPTDLVQDLKPLTDPDQAYTDAFSVKPETAQSIPNRDKIPS